MPLHTPGLPPWVVSWARPGRLYAADGVTLKQLNHSSGTYQTAAADGDRIQIFFICRGNETRLSLGSVKGPTKGIFDIYVNGILDSAGYDDYAAASTETYRYIMLTQPIQSGLNVVELRVNGKNIASTNFVINVLGSSLQ